MTGAKILYDQFRSGGLPYVQALLGTAVETGLQDFKLFTSTNPVKWGSDDKRQLSEALSGFANSEGGLIGWGIDCRHGSDGEDVVQGFKPISGLTAVLGQMNTLSAQLVSPAIIGVEHLRIFESEKDDQGYIISYVPRGESLPHMAQTGHKFMYRSGSSFLPMSEWQVADRYGRRPQPKLRLDYKLQPPTFVNLIIVNDGLASAKFPGFDLHRSETFELARLITAKHFPPGIFWQKTSDSYTGQGDQNIVLHPQRSIEIGSFELGIDDVIVPYEVFCDGFYIEGSLQITRE